MHHAPAGPPLRVRLGAALLVTLAFVRRTRLLPVLLAGLVIGGLALAGPPSAGGQEPGTAALTSPSDRDRGLVPATGGGWTRDGAPADRPTGAEGGSPVPATGEEAVTAPDPTVPAGTPSSSSADTPAPPPVPAPGTSAAAGTSTGTPPTSASVSASTSTSTSGTPSSSPSAPSTPSSAPVVTAGATDLLLAAVDAARAEAGCGSLTVDAALADAAAAHSTAMRDQATLLTPAGAGAVASGAADPAAGWLADPEIRALLTDCGRTVAGVGVVDGWWTLLLA